ncbi:MAG: sn-glycerol-1-phosphate dehydrogenase [Clostridia bacterium]|nr:sn-glycerol-1-phosphate dehydrogenase [Clostridia bacterium]
MEILNQFASVECGCGKKHSVSVDDIIVEKGAILRIPEVVSRYGAKRVFVLADVNTYAAAGARVCEILDSAGIAYSRFVFPDEHLEPDDKAIDTATDGYDPDCDLILGVGSGVINDIGKILADRNDKPYIIFGTAPSMDGYASATSSMAIAGLKVSMNSKCASVIMADTDILRNAPKRLLQAGLGDMLAKYVAVCEWRIASVVVGEYYCPRIAELILSALKKCVDNAEGLLRREEDAVIAVFEGLVIGGIAMSMAGCSRPASGVEHYYSHVWDMRGLAFGTPIDLHGIQCAIGTRLAIEKYEQIKTVTPDRESALDHAARFDFQEWSEKLRSFIGGGAEAMIALEAKEHKYDTALHAKRLEVIIENWDKILELISTLPSKAEIDRILDVIEAPKDVSEIGIDPSILPMTFAATKDIRDKYVLSRLFWDLGVQD